MRAIYPISHAQATSLAFNHSPSPASLQAPSQIYIRPFLSHNNNLIAAMAIVTSAVAGNDIIDPVVQLMAHVINQEYIHQILQIESGRMEALLQDIILFRDQQKAAPEIVKIWLQLLHNSLAEAKYLLHRSGRRQRCVDSIVSNPRRPSKQVRDWKALFNHLCPRFQSELMKNVDLSRGAIKSHMVELVMELLNDVINKEDSRQILQTEFRRMESLLQDTATLCRDNSILFPRQPRVPWLQLLQASLAEVKGLLDRPEPRQSCLRCVVHNPSRLSKEVIREWNILFDRLYHGFQNDLSISVTSLQFLSSKPLMYKLEDAAASEFVGSGIIDAQAQAERWLNEGDRVLHLIGVYGMPGVGKTSLLKMLYNNKVINVFYPKIWVTIPEYYTMFDLQRAIENQLHIRLPDSFDERKMKLSAYLKEKNFLLVLEDLGSRLDLQEVGVAFGDGRNGRSKVLFSTRRKELIGEMGAEESIEIQPLSRDEGWMLFRRVAFKDDPLPMDIQERALRFAEECKGVPLAIKLVAAMIGQTPVDEWDTCFSLLQKNNIHVDLSFPAAHPRLLDAPQLYTLLRWSYDALPNSNLKKCFLYCAMYKEDEVIDSRQLVEMWIGEGLVKSKQGTHLMDTAIGRNYLKLLIDRCFFQIVKQSTDAFRKGESVVHDVFPSIRVHHALIREMAVYIAQKEENSLLMGSQNLRNFPEAHYENCRRISFPDGDDLPADLRCPNLSTLILQGNTHVKELLSQFLLSLTSLRVLNLSGCTGITSVPSSVGQLRLLQFLSLSNLTIEALPEEVCHLSELQFLDLSRCKRLDSLPSQIGQLRNLQHLNLDSCYSLKMIPRQMYELTSLSRLQLTTNLSVEMGAPASIWSLKGLKSLTELEIWIDTEQQDGKRSRIKDGIMGTWLEMRHLALWYRYHSSYEDDLLPEDMQNMKKLQSFMLSSYKGLNLPNCKFEHLEMVKLDSCDGITKLCPLERLPNLKILKLEWCDNLRQLGMGSPGGYVSLQKLVLTRLSELKRLDAASQSGEVWDERTLPQLRVLRIRDCPSLKRLPRGMEKLQNLCAIISSREWWEGIVWDDDNIDDDSMDDDSIDDDNMDDDNIDDDNIDDDNIDMDYDNIDDDNMKAKLQQIFIFRPLEL